MHRVETLEMIAKIEPINSMAVSRCCYCSCCYWLTQQLCRLMEFI